MYVVEGDFGGQSAPRTNDQIEGVCQKRCGSPKPRSSDYSQRRHQLLTLEVSRKAEGKRDDFVDTSFDGLWL